METCPADSSDEILGGTGILVPVPPFLTFVPQIRRIGIRLKPAISALLEM